MSSVSLEEYERRRHIKLRPAQVEAFDWAVHDERVYKRACLYYKTGAGKTLTALIMLDRLRVSKVLVIAPPSTENTWTQQAAMFGIDVTVISHALFRQKSFKPEQGVAVICDEFHMLGKNTGPGFIKFKRLANNLRAHVIILSATPNYNDADRCYCVETIIDPLKVKGGHLQFIADHCETAINPYSVTPKVIGFRHYDGASDYLSKQKYVYYVPDDEVFVINDIIVQRYFNESFDSYNLDLRRRKVLSSPMEIRQRGTLYAKVDRSGNLTYPVEAVLTPLLRSQEPIVIFCQRREVALALMQSLERKLINVSGQAVLVDGRMKQADKLQAIEDFRKGKFRLLVGTSTLATGTDGLDVMCDTMIILDDTPDDSLRRQLVGRILPRTEGVDASTKKFYRFVVSD